jgi:ubiquinone/menaquinone biosynthesis C-methylase UbiE
MSVNAQYNVATPHSLPVRIATYQRRKMFEAFLAATQIAESNTILDVGVTSDRSYEHSNYLEAWYPQKAQITGVGIDDASFLEAQYPGLAFVRADGSNLPFATESFDFVHSSAVLEHVGATNNQISFLRELWRVARIGIFVTTPNRWFPIEFHTLLPVAHWLPQPLFRRILISVGKEFFASEENLNLLSRHTLADVAHSAGITGFRIDSANLLGWPTNLLLSASKTARPY